MNEKELINLYDKSLDKIKKVAEIKERDIFRKIDWDNNLVCILGERGCGKTTLMLQHLNQEINNKKRALYVSLDCIEMLDGDLDQVVKEFYDNGVRRIYIDEIQYINGWEDKLTKYIKQYPDLKIVYTNTLLTRSNIAKRLKGEKIYSLKGLSFREYMSLKGIVNFNSATLGDIVSAYREGSRDVSKSLDVKKHFQDYLNKGYYPFFEKENSTELIEAAVRKVIERDFPMIEAANNFSVNRIKRLLMKMAKSSPDTPNMSRVYEELSMDRNLGVKMQNTLIDSGLMHMLRGEDKKKAKTFKPKKVYSFNHDLAKTLDVEIEKSTIEQTFFVNQLIVSGHNVMVSASEDFLVDNKYVFSVSKKDKVGLDDISNAYYVSNSVVGDKKTIPLWMFGMLY